MSALAVLFLLFSLSLMGYGVLLLRRRLREARPGLSAEQRLALLLAEQERNA
ncbi:MAG: hypothetical protein IGS03_14015 [Candidatus Sericytochromatia bacterium]|nr:hypothetical protein [Candidatus Sericytochromatia bacterium]